MLIILIGLVLGMMACTAPNQKTPLPSPDGELVLIMKSKSKKWMPRVEDAQGNFIYADGVGLTKADDVCWGAIRITSGFIEAKQM